MNNSIAKLTTFFSFFLFGLIAAPNVADAHCDLINGPVATAAREALATGNVDEVLIWVTDEEEAELTATYRQALEVYKQGGAAGRKWVNAYVKYIIYIEGLNHTIQAGPAHGVGE